MSLNQKIEFYFIRPFSDRKLIQKYQIVVMFAAFPRESLLPSAKGDIHDQEFEPRFSVSRVEQPAQAIKRMPVKRTFSLNLNQKINTSLQNAQDYDICLQKLHKKSIPSSQRVSIQFQNSPEKIQAQSVENIHEIEKLLFPSQENLMSKEERLEKKQSKLKEKEELFQLQQHERQAQNKAIQAELQNKIEQINRDQVILTIRENDIANRQRDAAAFEEQLNQRESFLIYQEDRLQLEKDNIKDITEQIQQKLRIIDQNRTKLMMERKEIEEKMDRFSREQYSRKCLFEEELFSVLAYQREILSQSLNVEIKKKLILKKAQEMSKRHNLSYILLDVQSACSVCYSKTQKVHEKLQKIDIVDVRPVKAKRNWGDVECSICLEEYNIGEVLTTLNCRHNFHSDCISDWLHKSSDCPLCKQSQKLQK